MPPQSNGSSLVGKNSLFYLDMASSQLLKFLIYCYSLSSYQFVPFSNVVKDNVGQIQTLNMRDRFVGF